MHFGMDRVDSSFEIKDEVTKQLFFIYINYRIEFFFLYLRQRNIQIYIIWKPFDTKDSII